jgi:hypothetical protein
MNVPARGCRGVSRLNPISVIIGAMVGAAGFVVLISWVFRLPGLSRIHPVLGGMNSHTAWCFVLAGTALSLLGSEVTRESKRRLGQGCAAIVIVISVLTVSEWYAWGVGISQFVPRAVGQLFPGRMPIATSLAFLSLGLALLLLDAGGWRVRPAEFSSFAAV